MKLDQLKVGQRWIFDHDSSVIMEIVEKPDCVDSVACRRLSKGNRGTYNSYWSFSDSYDKNWTYLEGQDAVI